MNDIEEAKARIARLVERSPEEASALVGPVEGDIGPPPDGPVPIVGEPGWIPDPPPPSRQTTTELVATLQQRYPEDAEVRALIGKVTGAGAEVTAANERAAHLNGRLASSQSFVDRYREAMGDVLSALGKAAGPEGAGPRLDGLACRSLVEGAQAALEDDEDE